MTDPTTTSNQARRDTTQRQLDDIDNRLVATLRERVIVAKRLAHLRKEEGLSPRDDERERAFVERAGDVEGDGARSKHARAVLENVLTLCRKAT